MDSAVREQPAPTRSLDGARRIFGLSMLVSGIRCAFTYVLLPFVTPFVGFAPGVGPGLGILLGVVAIGANVFSLRRFWRVRHPWRRPITALHIGVIALLVVLIALDFNQLLG